MVLIAKIAFSSLSTLAVVGLGILIIASFWVIGYFWDSIRGYQYEAEWGNKRNPTIAYIKRKV